MKEEILTSQGLRPDPDQLRWLNTQLEAITAQFKGTFQQKKAWL